MCSAHDKKISKTKVSKIKKQVVTLMSEHPIEGLMNTAMQSIKEMVDVNTIVGDAVQTGDGTVIIPISKVSFGFAAGGGEYCSGDGSKGNKGENTTESLFPFAGGSGAGVSISPVAFMVVGHNNVRLLPCNMNSSLERIIELLPEMLDKASETVKKKINTKHIPPNEPATS